MSIATINESELLRTALVGDVTSPVLGGSPYDVSADGVPFVPVGAGGICYNGEGRDAGAQAGRPTRSSRA